MNIPCFCPPIDGQQDSFPSFAVITKLAIISVDSILRRGVPSQRLFAMLIDSATLPPEGGLTNQATLQQGQRTFSNFPSPFCLCLLMFLFPVLPWTPWNG